MALESGGIDAQVEQRMDAYRNNPQQLQQRSKMSGSLLDLLALQKITSEKQAVARDMQMKMQQQPGTIAQQREQQAVQLAKQEMGGTLGELAGRTKGTLDQKQKMQQQNMQRVAKAQPPRPAGIAGLPGLAGAKPQPRRVPPPQTQGLAGARMAQAAAQGGPRRMASGGIVSFQTGEEVTSPFRRKFNELVNRVGEDMALQRLRQQVKTKYGLFASPVGGLRAQSDDQRAYAKKVLDVADSLGEAELLELADADFKAAMSAAEVDALPALPMSSTATETVTEDTITDTTQTESLDPTTEQVEDQITGNVVFTPIEPPDFFKDIETSYEPTTPKEADKTALNASIAEMTKQAGQVPTRDDVAPLEVAPLEFVEAPYDAQGQEILRSLTARYAQDMQADPLAAMQAAGASSDAYFDREGKAATYAQQEADERALQAETLDPDRLKKLARMQTLAGGRRGAGGIGQAYVDAQLGQDKRRSAGLETLRGIQDTGITTDTGIASYGAQSRENAASRAEARRVAGIAGARGLLTDQENRARQQQKLQNEVNVLNKTYEQEVSKGNYNAAREALIRQGQALREVVGVNADDVNNQVKVAISVSEDENESRKAAVERALEAATERSKAFHDRIENLSKNRNELIKMRDERAKVVYEAIATQMAQNPLIMSLSNELRNLSEAENPVKYAEIERQLDALRRTITEELVLMYDIFADAYGSMNELNLRIQELDALTGTGNFVSRLDPTTTPIETIEP